MNGETDRSAARDENEVSLLDLILVLVRNRTLITWTVAAFVFVGVAYVVLSTDQYTSSATVVREQVESSPSVLSGGVSTLRGLGINLGAASSGLSPSAYLDVLRSREVRHAVVEETYTFPDVERPMTFVEYVNRPPGALETVLKYTLELPWTVVGALRGSPDDTTAAVDLEGDVVLSKEEHEAIKAVSEMLSASVNPESGLMTISVTAMGPDLSADLARSFVQHLTSRVRTLRTEKIRQQLSFAEERFNQVESELKQAEDRLAQFLERNQNPTTATLRFQRDRLQQQVSFKEQLYSELQSQVTQTRFNLQRQQPVVTVVEHPVAPTKRSAPRTGFILVLSLLAGSIFGVLGALLNTYFQTAEDGDSEREKLTEIKQSLELPSWITTRVPFLDKPSTGPKEN
ncbi:Wzz/FepE/Etk N-terminal domain-containing protein [Longibacter sp.]|uniref:Wzz/FepE/Etk N-terminal domain-containing protein n=1 Tax=Longibacter sp. TaxID=2045415 RepID=UPI003EBFFD1F